MSRDLHTDPALRSAIADQVALARARRRRELLAELAVAEGAGTRAAAQRAGRAARTGVAAAGAVTVLLAPGMSGVAAAQEATPADPGAEQGADAAQPAAEDQPPASSPGADVPAPEEAAPAGDDPVAQDEPAGGGPAAEDAAAGPVGDDDAPPAADGDEPGGDGQDAGGAEDDDEADDAEDAGAGGDGDDAGDADEAGTDGDADGEADDADSDGDADGDAHDADADDAQDADDADDADDAADSDDADDADGADDDPEDAADGADGDATPGNGGDAPGQGGGGLIGDIVDDVVDEVVDVIVPDDDATDDATDGDGEDGAADEPEARPEVVQPPRPTPPPTSQRPTPADPRPEPLAPIVDDLIEGIVDLDPEDGPSGPDAAPERVDPVSSPLPGAAPIRQAQTAPPVRTVVDPSIHPAMAPTVREVDTDAQTLEERIRLSQARPVDAARVDDWTRAVVEAWQRMQAGVPGAVAEVAAFDEVAATPTLGWSYEVKAGDSLWEISEALWGTGDLTSTEVEATWQLIYTWNADRLGDDPDRIPTGVVIQIPIDTRVSPA